MRGKGVLCRCWALWAAPRPWVLVLRKNKPELTRPYKVPLYPILPGAYVLFCAAFVLNSFREKPFEAVAGLVLVLLGVPVYKLFNQPKAA